MPSTGLCTPKLIFSFSLHNYLLHTIVDAGTVENETAMTIFKSKWNLPLRFAVIAAITAHVRAMALSVGSVNNLVARGSVQVQAVCESDYSWMENTKGQSPCVVAAWVEEACASSSEFRTPKLHDDRLTMCNLHQHGSFRRYLLGATTICQTQQQPTHASGECPLTPADT